MLAPNPRFWLAPPSSLSNYVRDFDDDGHFHEYFEPAVRERLIRATLRP